MVPIGDWIATLGDALAEIDGAQAGLIPVLSARWLTWMAQITGRADARLGLLASAMALRDGQSPRYMTLDIVLADRRKRGLRSAAG
jgi:hypothetical protein